MMMMTMTVSARAGREQLFADASAAAAAVLAAQRITLTLQRPYPGRVYRPSLTQVLSGAAGLLADALGFP